jgi:uncharacterized repeat protein (TIGR03803 family)
LFFILAALTLALAAPAVDAETLKIVASFSDSVGGVPSEGGLIIDPSGNIYGTTKTGGDNGSGGTIYEVSGLAHTISTLASFPFSVTIGISGPTMDSSGNLYGTRPGGGAKDGGAIFEYSPSTLLLTTPFSFTGNADGFQPTTNLIADSAGNFYGTTSSSPNGSTVFEFSPTTHVLTTLATLPQATAGADPHQLVVDSAGDLYGTTGFGGANNLGTIFKVDAVTHAVTVLAAFTAATGNSPVGLLADASGNFYGTTLGGPNGDGTIFKYDGATGTITTLFAFSGSDGASPFSRLISDANGNLYGTTRNGGDNGSGTIYEFSPSTQTLTTLVCSVGSTAPLVMDSAGNLYGTTGGGGDNGLGGVFEVSAPEPGPAAMLGIAALALSIRRRR